MTTILLWCQLCIIKYPVISLRIERRYIINSYNNEHEIGKQLVLVLTKMAAAHARPATLHGALELWD